jgi:uroporphyrinogen-III decarboxylase
MRREFYLDLATAGLRMPVGANLVLHRHDDPEAILVDGQRLGQVVAETARRYHTPLAVPLMDLSVEKTALLEALGVPTERIPTFHFEECPADDALARLEKRLATHSSARVQATVEAVGYVARQKDLLPIGMAIGPFSLTIRLINDPIGALYAAGRGVTPGQNAQVATVERVLALATQVVEWSLRQQIAAGAKAIWICEPAASTTYVSPRQLAAGATHFDRYVMERNRQIKQMLAEHDVDLIFHCCGEITDEILRRFTELDPVILSLGGSRKLWDDAALVPKRTVLFGNLPSKKFFSDTEITREQVERLASELTRKMRGTGHPFVLGTECDVLSVPGRQDVIEAKVEAFMNAG